MISKKIIIAISICTILFLTGIYFFSQHPYTYDLNPEIVSTTSKSIVTETRSTPFEHEETPTVTLENTTLMRNSTIQETLSETLLQERTDEEREILELITRYFESFNNHQVEENVALFHELGKKCLNGGIDGECWGRGGIRKDLTDTFNSAHDLILLDIRVTKLEISGDKAFVQTKYRGSAQSLDWFMDDMTENMELAKVDEFGKRVWRITKTDIIY